MLILVKLVLILLVVFVGGFLEHKVDESLGLKIPGGTRGVIHTCTYNLIGAAIGAAIIWLF